MNDFLKDTYGCVLYQEQVMQACVVLGGMTMVEADKVRKIIGKKKDAK
jgi:DNA polymerase-3 subunit alpha